MQLKENSRVEDNNNEQKDSSQSSTIENSSDEDLNSDNEWIDLRPLWRDRPFLSDSTSDEEQKDKSDEDDTSSLSDLTPNTSTEEKDKAKHLRSLINKLKNILDKAEKVHHRHQLGDQEIVRRNPIRLFDSDSETDSESYSESDSEIDSESDSESDESDSD